MFTAYFDDSGTHDQTNIAIAACYVGETEQWKHFERNWGEANERYNFGIFHMTDFVSRHACTHLSEQEGHDLLYRLICIAKTRARMGFISAVLKNDYDRIIPGKMRDKCGKQHYTFAVRSCLGFIKKWREQFAPTGGVKYVFDRMNKKGEILAAFDDFVKWGNHPDLGFVPGGYTFEDRSQVVPLQAADILAWEGLWQMREVVIPKKPERRRPEMGYIASAPLMTRYFDAESLEEFRDRMTAYYEKFGWETKPQ